MTLLFCFYFAAQSSLQIYHESMKEQEVTQVLSDIRDMMERSQKVLGIDGASSMVAAVWALLGALAGSWSLYGSLSPLWGDTSLPMHEITPRVFAVVAIILAVVFAAAFFSVWGMSRRKAARKGKSFIIDRGTRLLLKVFFTTMVTGGLVCLTPILNGHWELIPGYMLVFYGLAVVLVTPSLFSRPLTRGFGVAQLLTGLTALCLPQYGLMCWTIGFCLIHFVWGIWFHFFHENKSL